MPPLSSLPAEIGFYAEDFRLLSINNTYFSLDDIRGSNGFVIAFICNHCPYVKAIAKRISSEAEALARINIGFVAINSNDYESYPEDSFDNMKIFAKDNNFSFPYLIDSTQSIAEVYQAVCTPDFFGFNSKGLLMYRGRLDDGGKNGEVKKRDLYEAMKMVSNNNIVNFDIYPSIGCSIKWKKNS
ncbi:thioredoxin family protein [Lyticum sinuosum]|uniref:Thioredoxin family protein n=1 Tax=Lyticum sinuosum TaxID=1332059 RepID=A0AAE5AH08_9RICK|nr:thioredoxin family protein [Lyticum sinuosum]MDZ5761432.1 Thioredoxin family protein [Lyticum sinuosum]